MRKDDFVCLTGCACGGAVARLASAAPSHALSGCGIAIEPKDGVNRCHAFMRGISYAYPRLIKNGARPREQGGPAVSH